MAMTLEQLLAEVRHEELSCVAGFDGLHKEVTGINVMDTPDIINWVGPGDLLVSAGYVLHQNPHMVHTLVEDLMARGCVGLGIKEKRYFDAIPQELIEKGNALGFPIFSISSDLRFSTVSQFVFQSLFKVTLSTQEQLYRLYTNISKTLLADKNVSQALYEISQVIPLPIFLLNRQMELIACEVPADNKVDLSEYLMLETGQPLLSTHDTLALSNYFEKHPSGAYSYPVRDLNDTSLVYNLVVFPLLIDEENFGYLGVFETSLHLDPGQYALIEEIGAIIGLHLLKNRLANSIPQLNYRGKFISSLLKNSDDLSYIQNHCNLYGFDYTKKRTCIVLEPSRYLTAPYHTRKVVSDLVYAAVEQSLKQNALCGYSTQFNNCFIWFILFSPQEKDARILQISRSLLDEIERNLNQQGYLHVNDLRMGLSHVSQSPRKIVAAFNQAQQAIKLGRKLYPDDRHAYFFDQDLPYHVLSYLDKERLDNLVEWTVAPLIESDDRSHTELLLTLEAFFENQFNYGQTAGQLHVHRNTLTYRLTKIQELTQTSIENDRDMLNLQLGLHAHKYLEAVFRA